MRVYISGPMTGIPDLNRPVFDAAEKRLTEQGHFVINPHRISALFGTAEELIKSFEAMYANPLANACESHSRRLCLARAVMDAERAAIRSCDAIYLLRGWEKSCGAKNELADALADGLTVMQEGN